MGQGASGAAQGLTGIAATAGGPWGAAAAAAANIGLSLAEASSQKELATAADRTAQQAAAEQKRLLSQNYFDALQVPMQAYDKAFRETTAQQQQAMSALQEGDPRLLLGGVGKVQAVAGDQEAATRDALAQQLFDIQKTQAIEGTNINQNLSTLEGNRLAGAQKASAAAKAAELDQQQAAINAGGDLLKGLGSLIPDYSDTTSITEGTGSDIFNKFLKNQPASTSQLGVSQLAAAPFAPSAIGQSAFNPFAAISTISPMQNSLAQFSFNPKRF